MQSANDVTPAVSEPGALHALWVVPMVLSAVLAVVVFSRGAPVIGVDAHIAALSARLERLGAVDPSRCVRRPASASVSRPKDAAP